MQPDSQDFNNLFGSTADEYHRVQEYNRREKEITDEIDMIDDKINALRAQGTVLPKTLFPGVQGTPDHNQRLLLRYFRRIAVLQTSLTALQREGW